MHLHQQPVAALAIRGELDQLAGAALGREALTLRKSLGVAIAMAGVFGALAAGVADARVGDVAVAGDLVGGVDDDHAPGRVRARL